MAERTIASYPLPLRSIACVGSMVRATSSSGAPRKVAGIMFENVLAIYADTIVEESITGRNIGSMPKDSVKFQNRGCSERSRMETVFMCIPGMREEVSPMRKPKREEIRM